MPKTYRSMKDFAKALTKYTQDTVKKSAVTAINKSLASTKSQATSIAAKASGAKQKDIKRRLGLFKASGKNPSGSLVTFAKPMPLSIFSPRTKVVNTPKGKRVGTTIKGPEGRQLIPGAALAKYASGKLSVFSRIITGKAKGLNTYGFKNLYTNLIYKILGRPQIQKDLTKKATDSFNRNFQHEMSRKKDF